MQIKRWLYLTRSLGEFPFTATCSKKNRQEQYPFIATISWIVLAVRWSVKYCFAPNSSLFQKSGWEKRKRDNYKAFCFSSKHNNCFHCSFIKNCLVKIKINIVNKYVVTIRFRRKLETYVYIWDIYWETFSIHV